MQIFVRHPSSSPASVEVDLDAGVSQVKYILQNVTGVPADDQILVYSGKMLHDAQTLRQAGVLSHSTLHVSARLRGGKPVKVKMMTNHLPCGPEVTIDIEPEASKDEIKQKLAVATGVPVEHQKVMLSGINQIVMGDKRTNVGFSACGHTNGVQMAVNSK